MKQIYKRLTALLLVLVLTFASSPFVLAEPAPGAVPVHSGIIGAPSNLPWTLYSDGTLMVEPGHINWHGANASPWAAHSADIQQIVFTGPVSAGASLRYLFYGLENVVTITGLIYFDTSNVSNMNAMFMNASSLTHLDLTGWDTSSVVHLYRTFHNASSLQSIEGLAGWDTGNVASMGRLFHGASSLTNLDDISAWDTSSVTDMRTLFQGTSSLSQLNLAAWDTSRVTMMNNLFQDTGATSVGDLSGWDVSSVTSMYSMFLRAPVTNIPGISNWDTSSVTIMSRMFQGASSLTHLNLSGWDTSRVTTMLSMFHGASSLTTVGSDGLANWDVSNVRMFQSLFQSASSLTNLNVTNWDTSAATNTVLMFAGTTGLTSIGDLSGWNTQRVTTMQGMFQGANSLTTLGNLCNWDVSLVTNMTNLFDGANSIVSLGPTGLANWNTANARTMNQMFQNMHSLQQLYLTNWNVSSVTNMQVMFSGTRMLTSIGDLSNWNTGNVTHMGGMFQNIGRYGGLTSLGDLTNWNTGRVANMINMFNGARHITYLGDLSNWNTSSLAGGGRIDQMFAGMNSLTNLNLSGWNVAGATNMNIVFQNTHSLETLNLSGWDTSSVTTMTHFLQNAHNLRRITFGPEFTIPGNATLFNLPNDNIAQREPDFTLYWVNINQPDAYVLRSNQLLPNGGPVHRLYGTWVWQRVEGTALYVYGTHRFPPAVVGYSHVDPLPVTVANVGTRDITVPITVTITGANYDDFILTISDELANGLVVGKALPGAIQVVPRLGLGVGTYTATIIVEGEGINTETFDITFTVLPSTLEDAVFSIPNVTFDGTYHMPSISVTLHGVPLVEGVDFIIPSNGWSNNRNAGTASVIIQGINNFAGDGGIGSTATGNFTINPRQVAVGPGNFWLAKVYDGTNSSDGATRSGNPAVIPVPSVGGTGLISGDAAFVSVVISDAHIDNFTGVDVGVHESTLRNLTLTSADGRHTNYMLVDNMVTVPAHITVASFPPDTVYLNVETGAVRTITIPISELLPIPPFGTLGSVSDSFLFNYTAGNVSTVAEIVGNSLVITTYAGKMVNDTETIIVRFDTTNFGIVDVPVVLTAIDGAPSFHTVFYEVISMTSPAAFTPAIPISEVQQAGTANIYVAPELTTTETSHNGELGTWIFSGWTTVDTTVTDGSFTMPNHNVVFTGFWTFVPHDSFVVTFLPGATTGIAGMPSNRTVQLGETISTDGGTVATPSRTGYLFMGWKQTIPTETGFLIPSINIGDIVVTQDMTFVAQWLIYDDTPPVTTPQSPPVTTPQQPPVTTPQQPPVTTPQQPPVTTPQQPPVATPQQPPVAIPQQPPVAIPQQPPVTIPRQHEDIEPPIIIGRVPLITSSTHHAFMIGYDGMIRPHDYITRAEVAAIVFRLITDEYRATVWSQQSTFSDVDINNWFNNAVSTMTNAGILAGMPDGTFQPQRSLTRAEFVVVMTRFFDGIPPEGANMFSDIDGHWAAAEINAATYMGWVSGFPDGTFAPDQSITRAEAAALIIRILGRCLQLANDLVPDMTTWADNMDTSAWFFLYIQVATNSLYFEMCLDEGHIINAEVIPPRDWSVLDTPYSTPWDIIGN